MEDDSINQKNYEKYEEALSDGIDKAIEILKDEDTTFKIMEEVKIQKAFKD